MTETCPICQAAETAPLGAYRNESTVLSGLTKRECSACGMVFASPMPSPEVWDAYNASYFETAHGSATDSPRARLFREGLAKVRVAQVLDQIGTPAPLRVIEVGAGYGEFMQDYCARVSGADYGVVDTDAAAREMLSAKGATVYADLMDAPSDHDLLVLSHVLEHTRDPAGFLGACLSRLQPGAHVFIDVPCRDDLYKSGDEPHLLFFDKPAMAHLLGQVGLREIEIGYFGHTHATLQGDLARPQLLARGLNGARRALAQAMGAGPSILPKSERVVLAPFAADRKQPRRARWLRAMAVK